MKKLKSYVAGGIALAGSLLPNSNLLNAQEVSKVPETKNEVEQKTESRIGKTLNLGTNFNFNPVSPYGKAITKGLGYQVTAFTSPIKGVAVGGIHTSDKLSAKDEKIVNVLTGNAKVVGTKGFIPSNFFNAIIGSDAVFVKLPNDKKLFVGSVRTHLNLHYKSFPLSGGIKFSQDYGDNESSYMKYYINLQKKFGSVKVKAFFDSYLQNVFQSENPNTHNIHTGVNTSFPLTEGINGLISTGLLKNFDNNSKATPSVKVGVQINPSKLYKKSLKKHGKHKKGYSKTHKTRTNNK